MALYERYACGNIIKEAYAAEKNLLLAQEGELKAQYAMAEQRQALLKEKNPYEYRANFRGRKKLSRIRG